MSSPGVHVSDVRPELAGGPLLDLGTYPVSFATWVLGPPATVLAAGHPHPAGVNRRASAILSDQPATRRSCTPRFSATPPPQA